ncbi:MAG: glycosyltransferase family 4 protein [Phycisphaerae bacterium]|nr:glycosyltransferase family 4 protein [Phycisphaerae bacterium]
MNESVNKKKKICFVCPKAYPLFNGSVEGVIGGAEVDLYFLATELAKDEGYEISCVVADYGQKDEELIENVRVIKGLDFKTNMIIQAVGLWKICKIVDADIYFLKTASPGVPLLSMFCSRYGKKFVYRSASSKEIVGDYKSKIPFFGRFFERALKKADLVLVQNQQDRAGLIRRCGIDSVVIANGHRIGKLQQDEGSGVLWVGRSAKVKGPEVFLELARQNPERKFTMICQCATGDDKYQDLADAAAGIDNLDFIEHVPFSGIDKYFSNAGVLINTSVAEGFANVFIQACIYGRPIITLNVNPDDFLNKYQCGICCEGDLGKMNEALEEVLGDKHGIYCANALTYSRENHDIVKTVEQYKKCFEKLFG